MHSIACPWVLFKIEERMSSRDRNVDSMTGTPECQKTVWEQAYVINLVDTNPT